MNCESIEIPVTASTEITRSWPLATPAPSLSSEPISDTKEAMTHLSQQVDAALEHKFNQSSVIDGLISSSAPMIPASEVQAYVKTRYAEASEAEVQAQAQEAAAAEAAIRDLQSISPEMIDQLDQEVAEKERQNTLDKQCSKYKREDIGNGQRFTARYGDRTKYCFNTGKWYLWDGNRWAEDERGQVNELAKETAMAMYREAARVGTVDAPTHAKWAIKSAGRRPLEYMLEMAKSDPLISIVPADLDNVKRCKYLFNVLNGTLDMTPPGPVTFRKHQKEDLITRIAGVSYDPDATCPLWKDHLNLIFDGKEALIDAFQEHTGYFLVSGNDQKIFEIWWGKSGNNGKTATQKVISQIMGSYAKTTGAATFMEKRNNDADTPRSDLMALRGARLVFSPETSKDSPLDVATVKGLTGGDPLSTRDLHGKNTVFDPEFTPIMVTNHSPRIRDTNDAIWNRIRRWPFIVQIPDENIISDFNTQLSEEGPGILNWMIEGLERLQARHGKFDDPEELLESTRAYRADQDIVLKFIDERCTLGPDAKVGQTVLYEDFEDWCKNSGEITISKKEFFKSFKDRKYRFYKPLNVRSIQGIRVKTTREEEEWESKTKL